MGFIVLFRIDQQFAPIGDLLIRLLSRKIPHGPHAIPWLCWQALVLIGGQRLVSVSCNYHRQSTLSTAS